MKQSVVFSFLILTLLLMSGTASGDEQADSAMLKTLYDADQEARSAENLAAGIVPTLQEERDRRFTALRLIAEGSLATANDYFHAGMLLHHTGTIQFDDEHFASLGTESKLLAFFLFRRSHQLGHKSGRVMMAAAYNYYLQACGEDSGKYGYKFEGHETIWRPNVDGEDLDTLKCGFDPRPYVD
ncbi:MAG: hypothetical protein WBM34_11545 [Woeseiaceae bacterium]